MNAFSNLLVCGLLQVTIVAAMGLVVASICSRWSRISAATFSFATLTAIVALTFLAFLPWPSWLNANPGDRTVLTDRSADQADLSKISDSTDRPVLSQPEPFGLAEFLSAGVEGLRNLNKPMAIAPQSLAENIASEVNMGGSSWTRSFVWLFAAGILMGMVRLIGGLVGVRLMVRSSRPLRNASLREMIDVLSAELACPVHIEVLESKRLATAATVGWRRPVILISDSWKSWSNDQLRSVVAHEIAHIARGDFASTVAAQLGLVLHFYHPLVHWLVNRLRLEQELAADAMAARAVGGSQVYLRAIGELALMQSQEHVSWPAHAFMPTRRTFLRRIEMLRDMNLFSERAPVALRLSSLMTVLAVTMAVAGIRPPGTSSPTQVIAAQPAPDTDSSTNLSRTQQSALAAKFVPANVLAVAVLRPAELVPFYRQTRERMNVPVSGLEKASIDIMSQCKLATIVVMSISQPVVQANEPFGMMLSFTDKAARDAAAEMVAPGAQYEKQRLLLTEIEVQGSRARYFADDTTLIFGGTDAVKSMVLAGPSSLSPLTQSDAWTAATKGTVAIAVDSTSLKSVMASVPPNPFVGMLSPFWMQADSHTLGIAMGDKVEIKLVSNAPDEKNAKVVHDSLNAVIMMLQGMVMNQKTSVPEPIRPVMESVEKFIASLLLTSEGNQISLTFSGDATEQVNAILGILAPAVGNARQAAQRIQQQNNFKQIMLAMHNHHDAKGAFPPAVIVDPASGAKRSWRIELLPYLENKALYDQYRQDQPWDSDANKAVLASMPDVYRHPSVAKGTANTSVFAAVGKGLVFEKDANEGTGLRDITDGSSNTIAFIEANREIPWTKPEDIEFDLSLAKLPDLGIAPDAWTVGICDGSVRAVSKSIDVEMFKKMLTRAGGEVVSF